MFGRRLNTKEVKNQKDSEEIDIELDAEEKASLAESEAESEAAYAEDAEDAVAVKDSKFECIKNNWQSWKRNNSFVPEKLPSLRETELSSSSSISNSIRVGGSRVGFFWGPDAETEAEAEAEVSSSAICSTVKSRRCEGAGDGGTSERRAAASDCIHEGVNIRKWEKKKQREKKRKSTSEEDDEKTRHVGCEGAGESYA